MLVIGLTGGIGSGKSTVADLFAAKKIPVIDADLIAKEITKAHSSALSSIIKHFGPSILLPNKELDRKQLRELIFNDPQEKKWLEDLLHPLIYDCIQKQLKKIHSTYCIVVIPLLLETESPAFIDRILVVDTPEENQISWATNRDNVSTSHIKKIIQQQIDPSHRRSKADDIILNEGHIDDLADQVEKLHLHYLKLSKNQSN